MSTTVATSTKDPEDPPKSNDIQAFKADDDTSLTFESITDGSNEREIPKVKFLENIGDFAASFNPPASTQLMIGAFSDLFGKFKSFETSLSKKSTFLLESRG